jgi:hypothetical protein
MARLIERLGDSFTFDPDGCWRWQRHTVAGYAHIRGGRSRLAHRVMYELLVGPIPEGLHIDHLCRNPTCVNPAHMEPVTAAENNQRGESPSAVNGRKATCLRGHVFDAANTYSHSGKRYCRACKLDRQRLARAAA